MRTRSYEAGRLAHAETGQGPDMRTRSYEAGRLAHAETGQGPDMRTRSYEAARLAHADNRQARYVGKVLRGEKARSYGQDSA